MINKLLKTLSIIFTIVLLCSCSIDPQSFIRNSRIPVSTINDPQINIIISPLTEWDNKQAKVLLAPVKISQYDKKIQNGVTAIMQDAFLQNKTFEVVAHHENSELQGNDFVAMAKKKGFDHIIYTDIVQFTASSGVSPGIISLHIKLVNLKQDTTIWKFYGEIQLLPRPSQDTVFLKIPYQPAPSPATGFSVIISKISEIICQNN